MFRVRVLGGIAVAAMLVLAIASPALAARATHAGEVVTLSKTAVTDGETITVSWSNFKPNEDVNLVITGEYPINTIPTKLNFAEFGTITAPTGPDGSGSAPFVVTADHGLDNAGQPLVCGQNGQQCWVIVMQPPFTTPTYNGVEITFGQAATPTTAAAAPTTTAAPTTEAPTTTAAPTTTTEATDGGSTVEEDEGSNIGLIVAIAAGVVILLGLGAYALSRRNAEDDTGPPAPLSGPGPDAPVPPTQVNPTVTPQPGPPPTDTPPPPPPAS